MGKISNSRVPLDSVRYGKRFVINPFVTSLVNKYLFSLLGIAVINFLREYADRKNRLCLLLRLCPEKEYGLYY